jgi:hypothetical protein
MRIAIWNCNMAFHQKYQHLLSLNRDIAVIPECANVETLVAKASELVGNQCGHHLVATGLPEHNQRNPMARGEHNKAAEHHENAAKSHRAAAERHGKGDHAKGKEHSSNAQRHS